MDLGLSKVCTISWLSFGKFFWLEVSISRLISVLFIVNLFRLCTNLPAYFFHSFDGSFADVHNSLSCADNQFWISKKLHLVYLTWETFEVSILFDIFLPTSAPFPAMGPMQFMNISFTRDFTAELPSLTFPHLLLVSSENDGLFYDLETLLWIWVPTISTPFAIVVPTNLNPEPIALPVHVMPNWHLSGSPNIWCSK